jgi:two-component system cell cycle response regulator DivK
MARILLIEDNELNRDMLSRRLYRTGHTVILGTTARRGIEMARELLPDLILMDLRLPDLNGWEAARQLRSDPATANIPLLALTAHAMEGDRERALASGYDDYDTKPIDLPRLLEKINDLLERGPGRPPIDPLGGETLPIG